jgi:hypothetical protein
MSARREQAWPICSRLLLHPREYWQTPRGPEQLATGVLPIWRHWAWALVLPEGRMLVEADAHMHSAQAQNGEQRTRVPTQTPGVLQVVQRTQTAQEVGEPTCSSRWRRTGRPEAAAVRLPLWTEARLEAEAEAAAPTCSCLRRSVRVREVLEIVAGERARARQQRMRDRMNKKSGPGGRRRWKPGGDALPAASWLRAPAECTFLYAIGVDADDGHANRNWGRESAGRLLWDPSLTDIDLRATCSCPPEPKALLCAYGDLSPSTES